MLIDQNNHEQWHGKTRKQIDKAVGSKCKSDVCREHQQAKALAPLREVFIPVRFSIQDCMSKPFKHCSNGERL